MCVQTAEDLVGFVLSHTSTHPSSLHTFPSGHSDSFSAPSSGGSLFLSHPGSSVRDCLPLKLAMSFKFLKRMILHGMYSKETFSLTQVTYDWRSPNVLWLKNENKTNHQHYCKTMEAWVCIHRTTRPHRITVFPVADCAGLQAEGGGQRGGHHHQGWTHHPGAKNPLASVTCSLTK